jgi:hypothetical protein
MKYQIVFIDEKKGQELHDEIGAFVQYHDVLTPIGTLHGFSNPKNRRTFADITIYVATSDVQHALNRSLTK